MASPLILALLLGGGVYFISKKKPSSSSIVASGNPLVPSGAITQDEKDACEEVLSLKPQPTSFKDDQGRVWTPCVEWRVGKDIPQWPAGIWKGQIPFLYKPKTTADWLGCIAGYLVYKGPLTESASKTFTDEVATVNMTKLLTARRKILCAYMTERLAELKRSNATIKCKK